MGNNFEDNLAVHATCVSNDFLDKFMADANGDYIKVYLFLLRHRGEQFNIAQAADALNLTEGDIERAIRYWEKQGVFRSRDGKSVKKTINIETKRSAAVSAERDTDTYAATDAYADIDEHTGEVDAVVAGVAAGSSDGVTSTGRAAKHGKVVPMTGDLTSVRDDEEFEGIIFVAKHVLPTLPTGNQIDALRFMYEDLGMKADLIEYLLEYCAGLHKTAAKYLQTVAMNWHEQGIATCKQAQNMIKEFEQKKQKKTPVSTKQNKFMNFDSENKVDYDSIAKRKLQDRMKDVIN